ncbi:adenylosuccinate synthase [candidate division KSB1 bacterium]|nr:adenylosuccinate synthase [candidate division KSB1 bacterium]
MSVTVVVGLQWGDEGKGKIVDFLSDNVDVVARYQGGANAGHTVVVNGEEIILHLIPTGILHPCVTCLIGHGVVVDPEELLAEIDLLQKRRISPEGRLWISDRAHLVLPHHKLLDAARERGDGSGCIGTTGRGIGPAYEDKISRRGIRIGDFDNIKLFEDKLVRNIREKNLLLDRIYGIPGLEEEEVLLSYVEYARKLKPYLADTTILLNKAIEEGEEILLEGAQGTLLDVDMGTYPYVTSSNPTSGGACVGLGLAPSRINRVVGVVKAYTTRVGNGPFPTEVRDELGDKLREMGHEYGATTGRPRRCGWFDGILTRHSVLINGVTGLALTKLDVLDQLETIKVCTAYQVNGKNLDYFPGDPNILDSCHPQYVDFEGWRHDTTGVRAFPDLPVQARRYVSFLEDLLGVKINILSLGSDRKKTILID